MKYPAIKKCPVSGKYYISSRYRKLKFLLLPLIGILSIIWFCVRVIPKPSRINYPCQKAAVSFASLFLVWFTGLLFGSAFMLRLKNRKKHSNIILLTFLISVIFTCRPFGDYTLGIIDDRQPAPDVYMAKNGTPLENVDKVLELMGGIETFIDADDIVVIKGNGQWPNRGYTNTECIKAVIDKILEIPGYSGEIFICDNVQTNGSTGQYGFDAGASYREDNWSGHNWNSLAQEYRGNGFPVSAYRWISDTSAVPGVSDTTGPGDLVSAGKEIGWVRTYFTLGSLEAFLSYPIFESPLTPGRYIDMKNGVWEDGSYTGQKVKKIFMPTLNYHGSYAGLTSAIKSFFGATEIINGQNNNFHGYYHIHSATYSNHESLDALDVAFNAGMLTGYYINNLYAPDLYITAAIYTGDNGRWSSGTRTDTILACENPASLDYISAKYVIAPISSYDYRLDPDLDNVTRYQILGCISQGIGTIDPTQFELIQFDFDE